LQQHQKIKLNKYSFKKNPEPFFFSLDLNGITFSHRARQRPSWQRSPVSYPSLHEADTVCVGKRDAGTLK